MSAIDASPPVMLAKPERLVSLDAYRGFAMFLMAAEMLQVPSIARHFPDSWLWKTLSFHSQHVAWSGCSLHDLIQPSFCFMVGVSLPFSLASRSSRGQTRAQLWLHALWRSLLLILLGVFLRSMKSPSTNWNFEDTLSQIGFGYPFLVGLGLASTRIRWAALAAIVVGYWAFFVLYTPPSDWSAAAANVPKGWSLDYTGFAAHWNHNRHPAWAFDLWFLNLFPRMKPFIGNPGSYSTLNFIPTLGTMLLGLIAGQWLKERRSPTAPLKPLIIAGAVCMALGLTLDFTGVCPSVKKIWTPAWILVSGGWCFFLMTAFYAVIDLGGFKRWAFPLVVIGMNSIAIYVLVVTTEEFFSKAVATHFGKAPFAILGSDFAPMLHGAAVLLILWLILLWMHRRKLFLRI